MSEGKRRRQYNAEGRRRHYYTTTPGEQASIKLLAGRVGLTVPHYLVQSALTGGGDMVAQLRLLVEELSAVRKLLTPAATNLNALTKAAHSGEAWDAEAAMGAVEILREVAGPGGLLRKALDKVPVVARGLSR